MKKFKFEYYPADMDKDMIPVCDALNKFRGVRTFFCCSGHGRGDDGFYICLGVKNMKSLKSIVRGFDIYGIYSMSGEVKRYVLEPDSSFWPLDKREICLRISNEWVSTLKAPARKREFSRIIKRLAEENKQ